MLWTGFIGLSAALASWVAGQGVDLQGGLQTIAQWPLPPWIALWTDAGTAEAVRALVRDASPKPDTHLPLELRQPGGLGLQLTRQLVDSIEYEYQVSQTRSRVTFRKPSA